MPFYQLKNALKLRGGEVSADGNSVSFCKNDDKLIFSGTNKMVIGLDGKKHERVKIKLNMVIDLDEKEHEGVKVKLNGEHLNFSHWLHEQTPILMTGNKVVNDKHGNPRNCIEICEHILRDLDFLFTDIFNHGRKKQSMITKKGADTQ